MKYKFNPLTGEFNLVPDSGTLKQKLNWLTGNFNLTKDASKYKQIYNVIEGEFNLYPATTQVVIHGTGSVQLTNAVANGLLSLTAFGGTEQSNLPKGYTQLEYIQTDGTQYIDTGIKVTQDNRVELRYCYYTKSDILTSGRIAGGRYTSGTPRNAFAIGTQSGKVDTATKMFAQFGVSGVAIQGANVVIGDWFTVKVSTDGYYINDTAYGSPILTDDFETPYTVKLFAFEQSTPDDTPTIGCGIGRCSNFKIYTNDVLTLNLIPVKRNSDNVLGMYDTVTGNFLTNSGTGTFTAGPNAAPTPTEPMNIVSNNGVIKYSKNLLDMSENNIVLGKYVNNSGQVLDSPYNFYNSKYIPVKPNTTYTWSTSVKVSYLSVMEYDSNKQFLQRTLFTNGATTLSDDITLRADTAYVLLGSNMDSNNITYEKISAVDRQFEEGNTATSYKPYVEGGVYVDGTTETINAHSKNLYNVSTDAVGYAIDANGNIISASNASYSSAIPVQAGQYTYSGICSNQGGSNNKRVHGYMNGVWVQQLALLVITAGEPFSYTFTVPDGVNEIRVSHWSEDTNSQIEQGSTATEYVPYFDGGTATAEMLLKVGDYADEQEILSGNIIRKVGYYVFDGTEDREAIGGTNPYFRSQTNIPFYNIDISAELCTHSKCQLISASIAGQSIHLGSRTEQYNMYFFVRQESICSASSSNIPILKQWLAAQYAAGTPVIVVYPLATPTTESVAGQTMNIPSGNSTIEIVQASLDNLELEATYEQEA